MNDDRENFRTATDRLLADPPSFRLDELAREVGVHQNTITRARQLAGQRRSPPPGWRAATARVARRHAADLERKARDLLALADELDLTE